MRCYICNEEATRFDKRDGSYVCDECTTSAHEAVLEFGAEYTDSQTHMPPARWIYVTLKEAPWDEEDTPDVP